MDRLKRFENATVRVDENAFENGRKKLRFQKDPDTCGRGLSSINCAPIEHSKHFSV